MKLPVENYMNMSREYCSSTKFVATVVLQNIIQLGLFHLIIFNNNVNSCQQCDCSSIAFVTNG